ncbi:MAG: hypothetical protein GDA36_07720 [Rhodobacteraceae bacterium]|nr:hypothetical protein [Paracoccaceae bacterium]
MRLPVFADSARSPPAPVGRFVLASPNYRAALHRGIGIAQSLKQRLQISLPPRFSEARRGHDEGSMTGGCSHDPVTVTAQGVPVDLAGTGPVGQYPPAFSPL